MTAAVMEKVGGAQALPATTGGDEPVFDEDVARTFLETMADLYDDPTKYVFEAAVIPADGRPVDAAHFHGGEIDEALEWWRKRNARRGVNAYVGAAQRDPDRLDNLREKRAKDDHVADMRALWCDFDDEGAARAAAELLNGVKFIPHMVVTTGTVPHLRMQVWWLLEEPVTPDDGGKMIAALSECLVGDRSVKNPSRVMRLPGSFAWRKPSKPGRIDEPVTMLSKDHARYATSAVWDAVKALGGRTPTDDPERSGGAPAPALGASTAIAPREREALPRDHEGPCLAEAEEILGHIDADLPYDEWVTVLMGLHAEFGGEALDLADSWSSGGGDKYKPGEVAKKFASFNEGGGASFGSVCKIAEGYGANLSEIARRYRGGEAYEPEDIADAPDLTEFFAKQDADQKARAQAAAADTATAAVAGEVTAPAEVTASLPAPFRLRDPSKLPPRKWLYDNRLIRGNVALTVSPGGLGKSSLVLAEAVEMVVPWERDGSSTVGGYRHLRDPLRVMYINGEDPLDEIQRRVAATCLHYDISDDQLGDRLVLVGREKAPRLAEMDGSKPVLNAGGFFELAQLVRDEQIDVLVLDPLGALHGLPENDNAAINTLFGGLRKLADIGECAVELVHHSQKAARQPGVDPGIAQARGASALVDGARSARYLTAMTKEEAVSAGLEGPNGYFQVTTGKANLAPTGNRSKWFKMVSVDLENGDHEYPEGDEVGVVERWSMPDAFDGVSTKDLSKVQEVIAKGHHKLGPWRESRQAEAWAGYAVADVLRLDLGAHKAGDGRTPEQGAARRRVVKLLDGWLKSGVLAEDERKDPKKRTPVKCIVVPECEDYDLSGAADLATDEGCEA